MSNIQDDIEFIIKKHKTLTTVPLIQLYINRIKNRLMFKTPETLKLFGSTKKLLDKTINGENKRIIEEVKVALVQSNLVDNQYQQKSEVLFSLCTISLMLIS